MNKLLLVSFCFLFFTGEFSFAQIHEIGFQAGASNYYGDLSGENKTIRATGLLPQVKAFHPAAGMYYRYQASTWVGVKISANYTRLSGNDAFTKASMTETGYARKMRNLNFRTDIIESSMEIEYNFLRFIPGTMKNRVTPYVGGGLGFFYINPKAKLDGKWVALRPLCTEGQGFDKYMPRRKYAPIQAMIPVSAGLKFKLAKNITAGIDFTYRFTFTDYIDDVSTDYINPVDFYTNLDLNKAQLAHELYKRSDELNLPNAEAYTQLGYQRGNPHSKDSYFMILTHISYHFLNGGYKCFLFGR